MAAEQDFKNHAKFDPTFHGFLTAVALAMLIGSITYVVREPGWQSAGFLLLVVWLIVLQFTVRVYSLRVQDRVIRLEERLRLQALLSEPLRSRVGELSLQQLIALRFASDGEVAELVEKTLANGWSGKEIKPQIRAWRADHLRV